MTINSNLSTNTNQHFFVVVKKVCLGPICVMLALFATHLFFKNYGFLLIDHLANKKQIISFDYYFHIISIAACSYWLMARIINRSSQLLASTALFLNHSILGIMLPFFSTIFKILSLLAIFNILTQGINLPKDMSYLVNKITSMLIIGAISWILFKLVDIAEQLLLNHYDASSGNVTARKIHTQTLILKRVAYTIISVLAAGAILMLFDNVRALGASVLTTAGVVGLVLTFTAQRSLASIFSGLEIALTQPIKIGDSVLIDNEQGTIEEINFRNVIVKLWDWRRLIVPTSYFLEKSFQNWTREQENNLIGVVYLFVDFTLPVPEIRQELEVILSKSPLWDGNISKVQVHDLKESVMQLRILASARNANDVSNLRSEIREKLITYIVKKHPSALPKTRNFTLRNLTEAASEENKLKLHFAESEKEFI